MSRILNYVADLFHESWAIIGALSLIGFFIPRLNDYTPFILAVATVAPMTAGYKLHQRQISDQEDKIRTLSLQHASQVSAITRQHEMILTQSSTRISELEAEVADLRRPKFTEETRQIAERAYRDSSTSTRSCCATCSLLAT